MATKNGNCNDIELFNPILSMGAQFSFILVFSQFLQLLLKPFGQPGPVAQILAGFVLGPSGLSNIKEIKKFFFQNFALDYYESIAMYARMIIMFLMGLELDVPNITRNLRPATIIACGSTTMCTIFGAAIAPFLFQETLAHGSTSIMALIVIVILANTASPVVVRLTTDLHFAASDVGRLAVYSSVIGDTYAIVIFTVLSRNKYSYSTSRWFLLGFLCFLIVVAVVIVNTYLASWLNSRNRDQKYLKNTEVLAILAVVAFAALAVESMGFSSVVACFLMGSMFPKSGKSWRTLLNKLTYPVHNFIFPIYFGYAGFKADVTAINSLRNVLIVAIVILLSIGGKIFGTLVACHYLKIPLNEGVLLAFLMNMKGHVDLITLTAGQQNKEVSSPIFYNLMVSTVVINSVISGPLIAFMVKRENQTLGYQHTPFEKQNPESELRLLACVHGPRPVPAMLGLIAASRGAETATVSPYLMHLIELPKKSKRNAHRRRDYDEINDYDEDYGGNEVVEINEFVDLFTGVTGIMVHQIKAVSPADGLHEDVRACAEDVRASIVILPFHKHQRIDGKLESGKEGVRATNQKVLRHARCTVAIVVDRGIAAGGVHHSGGPDILRHVATLFFGGPDDREALGFSKRLGMHHHINLTVIRFLPAPARDHGAGVDVAHNEENVLMAISECEAENAADSAFLTDFYNRYVTSGQVGYVEKYVANGAETASALRDMADMYSLFVVGKGGRGHSPLTTGMSDWEECPELGTVGDLLASSDFDISGSILVIQQRRVSNNGDDDR